MDAHNENGAKPLNRRARRFITEYLIDHNGTQAAIRAGYAPSGARALASKMLSNVVIAKAVDDAEAKILQSNQITVARVARELALIAFLDPADILDDSGHLLPLSSLPPEIRRALPALDLSRSPNGAHRIRWTGKLNALIALAKHMSMFNNRIGDDPTDPEPFGPDSIPYDDEDDQPDPH